jgi:hypothetical protein
MEKADSADSADGADGAEDPPVAAQDADATVALTVEMDGDVKFSVAPVIILHVATSSAARAGETRILKVVKGLPATSGRPKKGGYCTVFVLGPDYIRIWSLHMPKLHSS